MNWSSTDGKSTLIKILMKGEKAVNAMFHGYGPRPYWQDL
jgi:hypothetical protein